MNQEQSDIIQSLRDDGYMVIIWTPEELADVSDWDLKHMHDNIIRNGNEYIDCMQRAAAETAS